MQQKNSHQKALPGFRVILNANHKASPPVPVATATMTTRQREAITPGSASDVIMESERRRVGAPGTCSGAQGLAGVVGRPMGAAKRAPRLLSAPGLGCHWLLKLPPNAQGVTPLVAGPEAPPSPLGAESRGRGPSSVWPKHSSSHRARRSIHVASW